MAWDRIIDDWKEVKEKLKAKRVKHTEADLTVVNSQRHFLENKNQPLWLSQRASPLRLGRLAALKRAYDPVNVGSPIANAEGLIGRPALSINW